MAGRKIAGSKSQVAGYRPGNLPSTPHYSLYFLLFFLILLWSFLLPFPLYAQSPNNSLEVMTAANRSYEGGDYAAAIDEYESLLESGVTHSAIYYNLGNAYYRQGDLGRAILNYRRAQLLSPRDLDIAANLSAARLQTVDRLEVDSGQPGLGQIIGRWVTMNEMSLLLLALWLLICILICLAIMLPRWRKFWNWSIVSCTVWLLIGLGAIAGNFYGGQQYPEAVVVLPEIDVTSGPGPVEDFGVEFSLHAGAEVQVIERRLGWRHIALPGELQGWVPTEAIELVADTAG